MARWTGVYRASNGSWYFKAQGLAVDPETGRWPQITRRGYATAEDARTARRQYLVDLDSKRALINGAHVEGAAEMTVGQLIDKCLDEAEAMKRLGVKTLYDYRSNVDAYIRPWIGHIKIHDLTAEHVSAWQLDLAERGATQRAKKQLSSNTIRLARSPLNRAFKWAVAQGLVTFNPVEAVRPPRKVRTNPTHWSPDDARRFLAWLEGDRLYPLWAFLLSTGLRIGELVWLSWSSIDFDRRQVRVAVFATTLGYSLEHSDGKSSDARRTIDLDNQLVELLQSQADLQQAERMGSADYERTGYVFTKPSGGSYHPQALSKQLSSLSFELGLPRLTAHGLRHTCATLMLANGVQPKVAAERLGHADPTLFMNLYSHVTPTMQRQAADALGDALFGPDAETGWPDRPAVRDHDFRA